MCKLRDTWNDHEAVAMRIIGKRVHGDERVQDALCFAWKHYATRGEATLTAIVYSAGHGANRAVEHRRFVTTRERGYVDALDGGAFERDGEIYPVLPVRLCSNSPPTRAGLLEHGLDPDDPASYRHDLGWSIDQLPDVLKRTAKLIVAGLSDADMCMVLDITSRTLRNHRMRIAESIPAGVALWASQLGREVESEVPDSVEYEYAE